MFDNSFGVHLGIYVDDFGKAETYSDFKDSHIQSFNLLVLKLFRFVLKLVFTIYLLGVFRRNDLSKTLVTNLSAQAEQL